MWFAIQLPGMWREVNSRIRVPVPPGLFPANNWKTQFRPSIAEKLVSGPLSLGDPVLLFGYAQTAIQGVPWMANDFGRG